MDILEKIQLGREQAEEKQDFNGIARYARLETLGGGKKNYAEDRKATLERRLEGLKVRDTRPLGGNPFVDEFFPYSPKAHEALAAAKQYEGNEVFSHYITLSGPEDAADAMMLVEMSGTYKVPMLGARPGDVIDYLLVNERIGTLRNNAEAARNQLKEAEESLSRRFAAGMLEIFGRYDRTGKMEGIWKKTAQGGGAEAEQYFITYALEVSDEYKKLLRARRAELRKKERADKLYALKKDLDAEGGMRAAFEKIKKQALDGKLDESDIQPGDEVTIYRRVDAYHYKYALQHGEAKVPHYTKGTVKETNDGKIKVMIKKKRKALDFDPSEVTKRMPANDDIVYIRDVNGKKLEATVTKFDETANIATLNYKGRSYEYELVKIEIPTNISRLARLLSKPAKLEPGMKTKIKKALKDGGDRYFYGGSINGARLETEVTVKATQDDLISVTLPGGGRWDFHPDELERGPELEEYLIAARAETQIIKEAADRLVSQNLLFKLYGVTPGAGKTFRKKLASVLLKEIAVDNKLFGAKAKEIAYGELKNKYSSVPEDMLSYMATGRANELLQRQKDDILRGMRQEISALSARSAESERVLRLADQYVRNFENKTKPDTQKQ